MPRQRIVSICGPTASGKSSLALQIARAVDGVVLNADALQVYRCWNVLTACPTKSDLSATRHRLYRHVGAEISYSVGDWLRDVEHVLAETSRPVIIVGGTGLYLSSLTTGLADIPPIPAEIREEGNRLREAAGCIAFLEVLAANDPVTYSKIDQNNPMRLQRAWEVLIATSRPISDWHRKTAPALVDPDAVVTVHVTCPTERLNTRIDERFDWMIENGALEECEAALVGGWNPDLPSSKALGARELISYLRGEVSLQAAADLAKTATHQFAKRQRTWFRSKMGDWPTYVSERTSDAAFDHILEELTARS